MKNYMIGKVSPVAGNNFKEIIWAGTSTLEAVQRVVDKKNAEAMNNNRLDYYELIEVENDNEQDY